MPKIATKTGDKGETGLLFGQRVPKTHKRINAVGDIDECSSFIGLAKFIITKHNYEVRYAEVLEHIQLQLVLVMGELNCENEKVTEYYAKFDCLTESHLHELDQEVELLQSLPELDQKGWVMYGRSEPGSVLDVASKICRRAERSLCEIDYKHRELLYKYMNRLSDFLYLLARYYDYILQKKDK